jgi:hypothetical protein
MNDHDRDPYNQHHDGDDGSESAAIGSCDPDSLWPCSSLPLFELVNLNFKKFPQRMSDESAFANLQQCIGYCRI